MSISMTYSAFAACVGACFSLAFCFLTWVFIQVEAKSLQNKRLEPWRTFIEYAWMGLCLLCAVVLTWGVVVTVLDYARITITD